MDETTILIWITIAIIGIIACIIVKLYYKDEESNLEDEQSLFNKETIHSAFSSGTQILSSKKSDFEDEYDETQTRSLRKTGQEPVDNFNSYVSPQKEEEDIYSFNKVNFNYDNEPEKFQEPMNERQLDIMTPKDNEINDIEEVVEETTTESESNTEHELKDLFTIDELIKESKRKDSEREKEAQKIKDLINEEEDNADEKDNEKIQDIDDVISASSDDTAEEVEAQDEIINTPTLKSPTKISKTIEEEDSEKTEEEKIADTIDSEQTTLTDTTPKEEEKPKTLKEEYKIEETSILEEDMNEDDVEETLDLDYRKDLAKITDTIKNSKIVKDVKSKLNPNEVEEETNMNEDFIRSVETYERPVVDDYEPIITETHISNNPIRSEEELREANTRRVFDIGETPIGERKITSQTPVTQSKTELKAKPAPSKDSLKIKINNNETTLKKGDEIIFNHAGETYSSNVLGIRGDEISVRYRRKNIKIKASDVKKIL